MSKKTIDQEKPPETPQIPNTLTARGKDRYNFEGQKVQETQYDVQRASGISLEFEEAISKLQGQNKLIALLGFNKVLQIRQLPEPFKLLSVQIEKKDLAEFMDRIEKFALPLNNNFLGDENDPVVSLAFIIPHKEILEQIMLELRKHNLNPSLNLASHQTLVLKTDNTLNSLENHLSNHHQDSQTQSISRDGSITKHSISQDISHSEEIHSRHIISETNYSSLKSLKMAQECEEKEVETPRNGECVYLMIDQDLLNQEISDPNLQKIINEINSIMRSPNFHITSYNGYLLIICTAERGGSSLAAMAARIYRTIQAKMFLGTGEIKSTDDTFSINGFPKLNTRKTWQNIESGVHMTTEFEELITDPNNRNSSLFKIESRKSKHGLLKLLSIRPQASLKIGGPDRLIGYEEKLDELQTALSNNTNKLVIIKGAAGMGKSRLTHEAIKELPYSIICSLDPSGEKTPGYGIMTIAEQIHEQIRNTEGLEDSNVTQNLANYDRLSQMEKLKIAQKTPQTILELCKPALRLMNNGKIPFVLDDIHHADRFSISHLMTLVNFHINTNEGKAVVLLRPEEIFEPRELKNLILRIKAVYSDTKSIKEIGVSGLDFIGNDTLAKDFVYHSIPKNLRKGKTLGTWYTKLAKIAVNQPFVMKSLMDALVEDIENNFDLSRDVIQLTAKAESKLDKILDGTSDLQTYYLERLNKLSPQELNFLQCVALIGGKFSTAQANIIATKISTITGEDGIEKTISKLVRGGYLVKNESEDGNRTWQIQHETTREIIVRSITEKEILDLNIKLYNQFNNSESIHPDIKLNIANNIANAKTSPKISHSFWTAYSKLAFECLEDSNSSNSVSRAYSIANMILFENPESRTQKIINLLKNPDNSESLKTIPEEIIALIIESLFSKAENALFLGKFKETTKSLETLRIIKENYPEINLDLSKVYELEFQKAYLLRKPDEMEEIIKKIQEKGIRISSSFQILSQIKLEFRKGNYKKAEQHYIDNSMSLRQEVGNQDPKFMEALRLGAARCPFELLRKQMTDKLDEDMELQAGIVKKAHVKQLDETMDNLRRLENVQKTNPLIFNKYEELALSEQIGITEAYLGNYEAAIAKLHEAWRIANQMEIHEQAARIAKFIGDILTISAITMPSNNKELNSIYNRPTQLRHSFDRERLQAALKTYTQQGIASVANIDSENFYSYAMRIQRIRTVGLLLISYLNVLSGTDVLSEADKHLEATMKEDLETLIHQSIADIQIINNLTNDLPENWKTEIAYYSSYIGYILYFAERLGIKIEDIKDLEILSKDKLKAATELPEKTDLDDCNLEEIERKITGLQRTKIYMGHIIGLLEI